MRHGSNELENPDSVDQKRGRIHQFLRDHADALSQQGSVQRSWRYYQGRRLGPFYRLAYREGGRQCSLYLGSDPTLAEEVLGVLEQMQAPRRHLLETERQLQKIKAQLKSHKRALDGELEQRGLHRKGNEIRGWRHLRQSRREPPSSTSSSAT
jgi:hypothetical protein